MWQALRSRHLADLKFRRQATIGPYIPDFVCIEARLVVEVDGGQHDEELDQTRTKYLEQRGFKVLRFWNNDVLENSDGVLETILRVAQEGKEEGPSPCPLPRAGEGKK